MVLEEIAASRWLNPVLWGQGDGRLYLRADPGAVISVYHE